MDQNETRHAGIGLGPGHIILDGDPAPPPVRGTVPAPNFRPISVVTKWLDAQEGTGLNPSDIVLHGDPSLPSQKGYTPPIFGPCLL